MQNQTHMHRERLQLNTVVHSDKVHDAFISRDHPLLRVELHSTGLLAAWQTSDIFDFIDSHGSPMPSILLLYRADTKTARGS